MISVVFPSKSKCTSGAVPLISVPLVRTLQKQPTFFIPADGELINPNFLLVHSSFSEATLSVVSWIMKGWVSHRSRPWLPSLPAAAPGSRLQPLGSQVSLLSTVAELCFLQELCSDCPCFGIHISVGTCPCWTVCPRMQ